MEDFYMKIAVPYDNGNVFQHFGRSTAFKYYEVQDGTVTPGEVLDTNGIGHEALANLLAQNGVDTVICGGLGQGALNALQKAGIAVATGAEGSADEAVAAYLRGELNGAEVNCDHHHEEEASEEGCGGSCGGCGGGCGGCGHHDYTPDFDGKNVGKTVRVHYRGTFDDGSTFDSSYDRGEPLEFVCGSGMMIHGFDKAIANMEPGQTTDIHLLPAEAYGEYDPEAVVTFQIDQLPGSENLTIGQRVHLQNDYGQVLPVRVTARDEKTITLDANHEMAGRNLNFSIELLEVR